MAKQKRNGFTLLEIMIVTAIIAAAVMMALPFISSQNQQIRSFLRQITVLSRELHTKARLHGVAYRMVIEIPPEKDSGEREPTKIYIEKGNAKLTVSEDEEGDALKREREDAGKETKRADPRGFQTDDGILKEPLTLPSSLYIERVELTRLKQPITSGRAFIHYLPQGLVDEAAIHIKGREPQAWTIAIHPLTGKAEIISKPISLKEIKSQ